MRSLYICALAVTAMLITSAQQPPPAQGQAAPPRGPRVGGPGSPTADGSRAVADGGIKVAGWEGRVDPNEDKAGMSIKDALLEKRGDGLHMISGPAVSYWKQ